MLFKSFLYYFQTTHQLFKPFLFLVQCVSHFPHLVHFHVNYMQAGFVFLIHCVYSFPSSHCFSGKFVDPSVFWVNCGPWFISKPLLTIVTTIVISKNHAPIMLIPLLSLLCSFTCHRFFPRRPILAIYIPKSFCFLEVLHLHLHCTRSELQPVSSSSLMLVLSLVKTGPPILKLQWGNGDTNLTTTHTRHLYFLFMKEIMRNFQYVTSV